MTRILHAGRTVTAGLVAFDIRWDGDLPAARSIAWSVHVTSPDAAETVELCHRVVDGSSPEQFVRDHTTDRRQDVDADADLDDGEITVRFPARSVGVAVEWTGWRAAITADGDVVAEHVLAPT